MSLDFKKHPYIVLHDDKFHAAFSNLRCAEDTVRHFKTEAARKGKSDQWTIGGIDLLNAALAPAQEKEPTQ